MAPENSPTPGPTRRAVISARLSAAGALTALATLATFGLALPLAVGGLAAASAAAVLARSVDPDDPLPWRSSGLPVKRQTVGTAVGAAAAAGTADTDHLVYFGTCPDDPAQAGPGTR